MNTPADDGNSDLRYAEYVLGVLDADERSAVEREQAQSEAAAARVALWRQRLLPLGAEILSREPPPHVWQRIRLALQPDPPERAPRHSEAAGLWESLRFWHWLNLGTVLLLATCVVLLILPRRPAPPAVPYMASALEQTNGRIGWTAFMDIEKGRMIVVPAGPLPFSSGRAPQLWLIPKGLKPISVGMISPSAPTTLQLGSALAARLGSTAILAVSVEPPGGSPTGQPTGAVIATGTIGAAPHGDPENGVRPGGASTALSAPHESHPPA